MRSEAAAGTDVCIAGNGVLGFAVARALLDLEPTCRIAIVGPADRSGGATRAAGAMLGSLGELTATSLATTAGRARVAIGREAARRWPAYLESLSAATGLPLSILPGTTVLLNAASLVDEANFEAIVQAAVAWHEPYELIAPVDVPGLSPSPPDRPLRALHLPSEGSVDARRVLDGLERYALRSGRARLVDGSVEGIERDTSGAVSGVRLTDQQILHAGAVVLTAGAASTTLLAALPEAETIPPVFAARGVAVVVSPRTSVPNHVVRTPVRSGGCGLHAVPHADGNLYIGATNEVSLSPRGRAGAGSVHGLLDAALSQVGASLYEAEIAEWRIGNRPLSLDGYPLVGPTGIDGLWLLTGTYREGFHCAPVLGPHLARMVLGLESTDVDPRFSPARPFLDPATPEESAHAYARHAASGALEHGARLPSFLGVDDLAAAARVRAMEVVEWLDLPVGLAPELVDAVLCSRDPRATATSLGGAARRLLAAHGNGLTSASTSKSDTIAGVTA